MGRELERRWRGRWRWKRRQRAELPCHFVGACRSVERVLSLRLSSEAAGGAGGLLHLGGAGVNGLRLGVRRGRGTSGGAGRGGGGGGGTLLGHALHPAGGALPCGVPGAMGAGGNALIDAAFIVVSRGRHPRQVAVVDVVVVGDGRLYLALGLGPFEGGVEDVGVDVVRSGEGGARASEGGVEDVSLGQAVGAAELELVLVLDGVEAVARGAPDGRTQAAGGRAGLPQERRTGPGPPPPALSSGPPRARQPAPAGHWHGSRCDGDGTDERASLRRHGVAERHTYDTEPRR